MYSTQWEDEMDENPNSRWSLLDDQLSGVRSSDLGSFMPEGSYRPVPIVRLVGAWVLHNIAMMAVLLIMSHQNALLTACITALVSAWIVRRALRSGMKVAATGWKVALVGLLALNWGLAVLVVLGMAGY
jgi:hypothetical protein